MYDYAEGDTVEIADDSMTATDGLRVGDVGTVTELATSEAGAPRYVCTFGPTEILLHPWEIRRH